jgi:hypothetical protein
MVLVLTRTAMPQEQDWDIIKARLVGSTGYSLTSNYQGPEGTYRIAYVVQGNGTKILTEVLEGSTRGAGSRILYDPAKDENNVAVQTSFLNFRRSLEARDIKDSPLHIPLFRQLVGGLVSDQPTEIIGGSGGHRVLVFGDKTKIQDRLEVDNDGNPVVTMRLKNGKEIQRMTFSKIVWGDQEISWKP